jgi:hypothetical protein
VAYLLVFLIAAAAGVAVYALTVRAPAATPAAAAALEVAGLTGEGSPAEGTYVNVSGWRPDWQSRLTGLLGLTVAIVLGAAAIALVTYLGFSYLFRVLGDVAST